MHLPSARAIYAWEGTRDIKNNIGPATANNIATSDSYYVSVDAGSEDFHFIGGTAPVDAGQDVGIAADKDGVTRPQGSGYDYGAYELTVDMDTYYVDIGNLNASNTNPGTEALPWLTIPYAVSQLQPGDTLYVKEGTYSGSIQISNLQGTANAWINILEYPRDDAVLYGVGVHTGRIRFSGCQYILFSGFEITNFNQEWATLTRILLKAL